MKLKALNKLNFVLLILFLGAFLTACGGDSSGGDSGSSSQGKLSIALTDSSTDEYQAVYVTIARVDVHMADASGWKTVASPEETYNLLELVNGVREDLGITPLTAGHYTQMRLILSEVADQSLNMLSIRHPYANYIISSDNRAHKLTIPSGTNTGLKIVHGFDINENETTELILDFDALRSVVKAGASGKYLLKPTIKILNTENHSIISGRVLDDATALPIPSGHSFITAQVADPLNEDITEQVVIKTGTLANTEGNYSLFLTPGEYNLVISQTGYLTECTAVTLQPDSSVPIDFSLIVATQAPGDISGIVAIDNSLPDQYVTLDFRQEVTCTEALETTMITVKTINIVNGDSYSVELPAGDYQIVASSYDEDSKLIDAVTVESGRVTTQNISF